MAPLDLPPKGESEGIPSGGKAVSSGPGVQELIKAIFSLKQISAIHLSQLLGVSVTDVIDWLDGSPCPPNMERLLIALFRDARIRHTEKLLSDLFEWGYPQKIIARDLGVHEAAVCRWGVQGNAPKWEHMIGLEKLHRKARDQLYAHWTRAHNLHFVCSRSHVHTEAHAAEAKAALAGSGNTAGDASAFVLDVRYADLASAVRAHTFKDSRSEKPVFVVVLNTNDSPKVQQASLLSELSAHVFPQVSRDTPAAHRPARLKGPNRTPRRKNNPAKDK